MEVPGTSVPVGLGKDGLPLGVQLIGSPGMDRLTIQVARVLEARLGGWTPPRIACIA